MLSTSCKAMRISDLPTDFRVGALNRDASINSSESASIPTSGLNSVALRRPSAGARESPLSRWRCGLPQQARREEGRKPSARPFPPPDSRRLIKEQWVNILQRNEIDDVNGLRRLNVDPREVILARTTYFPFSYSYPFTM